MRNLRSRKLSDLLKVILDIRLSGRAKTSKSRNQTKYIKRLFKTKKNLEGPYYDHESFADAPVK